jgi:hypothetical protein
MNAALDWWRELMGFDKEDLCKKYFPEKVYWLLTVKEIEYIYTKTHKNET